MRIICVGDTPNFLPESAERIRRWSPEHQLEVGRRYALTGRFQIRVEELLGLDTMRCGRINQRPLPWSTDEEASAWLRLELERLGYRRDCLGLVVFGRAAEQAVHGQRRVRDREYGPRMHYLDAKQHLKGQVLWPGHGRGVYALYLPHPSGRCRVWNDPKNRERAQALSSVFLREVGGLP